jgi:esterase/lipase superfamily enzyme
VRKWVTVLILLSAIVAGTALSIQPTVYLMPTPAVMAGGKLDPFALNPTLPEGNEIQVFYATNRFPAGMKNDRVYSVFPGNKLGAGIIHMRLGRDETTWQQILSLSTSADEDGRPALRLDRVEELARHPMDGNASEAGDMQPLFDSINRWLEISIDKSITIYVHGANTNVYRASAQAAQYHHFTGRNSLVLVYLWPSAENLFGYGTDTRHAHKSAPAFSRLLKLLVKHTDASSFNILAYSAGALIVSPALDILGRGVELEGGEAFRLGNIYYAAADIGTRTFVKHLRNYIDLPRSTTLSINQRDGVLALSARRNRESRIGRPNRNDLSPADYEWFRSASTEPELSIIEVSAGTVTGMRARSHDFWYSHPWVSSDVLIQFVLQLAPGDRGLMENHAEDGLRYWRFPWDYPQRITPVMERATQEIRAKGTSF